MAAPHNGALSTAHKLARTFAVNARAAAPRTHASLQCSRQLTKAILDSIVSSGYADDS